MHCVCGMKRMKTTYEITKINWFIIVDSISTQIQIASAWNIQHSKHVHSQFFFASVFFFRFDKSTLKLK